MAAKIKKSEDEEAQEKLKINKLKKEQAWATEQAALAGSKNGIRDDIIDLNGQIDKISKDLKPATEKAMKKYEQLLAKQKELEVELEAVDGSAKALRKDISTITDEVDKIEALIDCQLNQASFVINAVRDLGNACFKMASERIYKGLLAELAKQLNQIFLPLACFFNEDDKVLAITTVHQSTGFPMLKQDWKVLNDDMEP